MHTASITIFTGAGGDENPLTCEMSAAERVSSAAMALFSMGIACARSFSQSSLIALTRAASSEAVASSFATRTFTLSASTVSAAITTIAAAVSSPAFTSSGCSAVSSSCMTATDFSVATSFSKPTS